MRRWSLRSRPALTAVALTALGLLTADGAGILLFRSDRSVGRVRTGA